jgi:hypothetical protein
VTVLNRTLSCALLAVVLVAGIAGAQLAPRCTPVEILTPGRRASDSVVIGSRTVLRAEVAVRDAWKLQGRTTLPPGTPFRPGERVLVFRDSQPDGTAVFDGCRLVAEQLPLPTYTAPDSIARVEVWPSATVARFMRDRRGYQAILFTVRRKPRH